MEPTSSPDNARPQRGLARFWPVHREGEDEQGAAGSSEAAVPRPSETEMVALGSRRGAEPAEPGLPPAAFGPMTPSAPGPAPAFSPVASATPRGPDGPSGPPAEPPAGGPGPLSGSGGNPPSPSGGGSVTPPAASPSGPVRPPARDADHSRAADPGEDPAQPVESGGAHPWNRDSGSFGGFGLGGRNGRFLFGQHQPAEPRPGLNGHATELNGRPSKPDAPASTVDDPAPPATATSTAEPVRKTDENGRDDMSGRAGIPGFSSTTGDSPAGDGTPDTAGRRRDLGDAGDLLAGRRRDPDDTEPRAQADTDARRPADSEPRRQATGWASVPTSTNPVVSPTSAAPSSGAPAASAPVSGGYSQPPAYAPARPDPASGPVSGVPAPRGGAGVAVPVPVPPPAPAVEKTPEPEPAPVTEVVRTRRPWDEDVLAQAQAQAPAPRRSASLEDAEPARRGRRAAPDPADDAAEDAPLRPGDVAAGHIAFWDDDATRHFRAAWHEVKAEFVDDPEAALTRAHDLLTDAVNELTEALLAERDELDPLRGTATPDTESMRMAMRGYREFLDRILAL
jgi:hypothetical protein